MYVCLTLRFALFSNVNSAAQAQDVCALIEQWLLWLPSVADSKEIVPLLVSTSIQLEQWTGTSAIERRRQQHMLQQHLQYPVDLPLQICLHLPLQKMSARQLYDITNELIVPRLHRYGCTV